MAINLGIYLLLFEDTTGFVLIVLEWKRVGPAFTVVIKRIALFMYKNTEWRAHTTQIIFSFEGGPTYYTMGIVNYFVH